MGELYLPEGLPEVVNKAKVPKRASRTKIYPMQLKFTQINSSNANAVNFLHNGELKNATFIHV